MSVCLKNLKTNLLMAKVGPLLVGCYAYILISIVTTFGIWTLETLCCLMLLMSWNKQLKLIFLFWCNSCVLETWSNIRGTSYENLYFKITFSSSLITFIPSFNYQNYTILKLFISNNNQVATICRNNPLPSYYPLYQIGEMWDPSVKSSWYIES